MLSRTMPQRSAVIAHLRELSESDVQFIIDMAEHFRHRATILLNVTVKVRSGADKLQTYSLRPLVTAVLPMRVVQSARWRLLAHMISLANVDRQLFPMSRLRARVALTELCTSGA